MDVAVTLSCCHSMSCGPPGVWLATAVAAPLSRDTWADFLRIHN